MAAPTPAGQGAAVGVTADDGLRPGLDGGAQAAQGVVAIVGEAVEEMLGVVDHALACGGQKCDRLGDHAQVLLAVDLYHLLQVKRPRLADDRAHRREALSEHSQARVLVGTGVAPPGHAEGGDLGPRERLGGEQPEQLELLGIGARKSGLDQADP